jgi:hypothetical protein
MMTEQVAQGMSDREQAIREVLSELMEKRGIESLEELHRRFIETEYAHILVPGLHTGKPVSLKVFERVAYGQSRFIYRAFVLGMVEVLDFEPCSEEGWDFALAYTWGKRRGA